MSNTFHFIKSFINSDLCNNDIYDYHVIEKYMSDVYIKKCINNMLLINGSLNDIINKISQIVEYKNKYKSFHNICDLCKDKKVHSITYDKDYKIYTKHMNDINKYKNIIELFDVENLIDNDIGIIYIEPSKATNMDYYYICQHFMIEVEKCIINRKKFILFINMNDIKMKDQYQNMIISYYLYQIIIKCYMSELSFIYVSNLSLPLKAFTRYFSNIFTDKIILI